MSELTIFTQTYAADQVCDIERDVTEGLDPDYNDLIKSLPIDRDGFFPGSFEVTIKYLPED